MASALADRIRPDLLDGQGRLDRPEDGGGVEHLGGVTQLAVLLWERGRVDLDPRSGGRDECREHGCFHIHNRAGVDDQLDVAAGHHAERRDVQHDVLPERVRVVGIQHVADVAGHVEGLLRRGEREIDPCPRGPRVAGLLHRVQEHGERIGVAGTRLGRTVRAAREHHGDQAK